MKPMTGWNARTGQAGAFNPYSTYGETDDSALAKRMRSAAVEMQADGRAKLVLSRRMMERVRSLSREAEQLQAECADCGALLERLIQDARLMEACAEQAGLDCVRELPACKGSVRIVRIMAALCGRGDLMLTRERLMLAIASADEVQPLEMAELWAVPEAMRVALVEAYCHVAGAVLSIARERHVAEQWVEGRDCSLEDRLPAFFEHALQLLSEQEEPGRFATLERYFLEIDRSAADVVAQAHSNEALLMMRLDNLMSGKRLVDALDWQDCFEQLSAVEAELRYDPTDVYGQMEDESRAAVRAQVACIARKLKLSEISVARHAVSAAQAAKHEGAPQSRQTVCYWLYDDEGREALVRRMGLSPAYLPRLIVDPTGKRSVLGIAILSGLLFVLYAKVIPEIWLWPLGIPLAWCAAMTLIGRFFPSFVKPVKLLKMEINHIPNAMRTLVVMPVLISSVSRADQICEQMEALGCMEEDENIQYLILGDFVDANEERTADDGPIVDRMREGVRALNARAGWEKYAYLHRGRQLLRIDQRWMGRDRKRGALMDLNRLLLGENGAEEAFSVEGRVCGMLRERFRYVLTVDADTRFLPEALHRLIGTLAHPLNAPRVENGMRKGYAVLQPQMEMTAGSCVNQFVRLFAGEGGVNTYPTSVSNFWQDVTGTGIFGGKGLYDLRAFAEALDGALPEGKILSHDMIEGTLAGAALVSDVCFYDGFPSSFGSFLKRMNRWTRGDWQLLPILFSGKRFPPDGRRLSAAARVRLLDNLLRSLYAPALLSLLTQGVWFGRMDQVALGLLVAYWTPLLNLFRRAPGQWRRATAELAILPATMACVSDAILRTLWRLAFTGKHLLDWVTSADAEGVPGGMALPGRISAILMLPGLMNRTGVTAAIALAALFAVGPEWIRDMEEVPVDASEPLNRSEMEQLMGLAGDIWRFFEKWVTPQSHYLPPDNVQMDPWIGAARRTSPTNVGLYLMSAVSAWKLNFLTAGEAVRRMADTVGTMERMEKWRGHLYNWYDIDSLDPLHPRYVSSVDSGNLAAALLLCAAAVEEESCPLAERMRALARSMDFAVLYDVQRNLFTIGVDVENNRRSESHYDLLASESRILSMAAMMLRQIPRKHWSKLSRACVALNGKSALVSWSGTMFEYLMPELFVHAPANTLLGRSMEAVVAAQRAIGTRKNRPWGVSESGYYAFDLALNYQYRAFGLHALALGGSAIEDVVAPYASLMAAMVAPKQTVKNLEWMNGLGWRGDYGLYEAADYLRVQSDGTPRLVRSYMAHHQGMALCALCNALTDRVLNRIFARIPEARALELLMDEKPVPALRLKQRAASAKENGRVPARQHDERLARPERRIVDVHLLSGGGATALLTARGAIHYQKDGLLATRFYGDLLNWNDGSCVHLRRERSGETIVLGGAQTEYGPGFAVVRKEWGKLLCEMQLSISPEDGALMKRISIQNPSAFSETVRVADCVPVALCAQADYLAHPTFQNLFVESRRESPHAVVLRRRPRAESDGIEVLVHTVTSPGTVLCETDYTRLIGRMGSTMRAGGISWEMSDTVGTVLNPCSALQSVVEIGSGQTVTMHFAMGLTHPDHVGAWIERNRAESAPERAMQLATMQARAMLGFLRLEPRGQHLLYRCAALLFDRHLIMPLSARRGEASSLSRSVLWSMGISGNLPVILMHVRSAEDMACVREAIRACEFYRTLGVVVDLVFVDEHGSDYAMPVRDAVTGVIACSYLNDLQNVEGGVYLLEGERLKDEQRQALERAAALNLEASWEFYSQLRRALNALDRPEQLVKRMKLGQDRLPGMAIQNGNGYGGFLADGRYAIDVLPNRTTPAPWSNLMANEQFGILLTERGGGFLWNGNSRSDRLTAFANDTLHEGWGWMLYLVDEEGAQVRLLPGDRPQMAFRTIYGMAETVYRFETERLSGEVAMCVREDAPEMRIHVTLRSAAGGSYRLVGFVDWLMGSDSNDASFVRTWTRDGACFAAGTAQGVGYFAAANARVRAGGGRTAFLGRGSIQAPEGINEFDGQGGWMLEVPLKLQEDVPVRVDCALGCASIPQQAYARVRAFYAQPDYEAVRREVMAAWNDRVNCLRVETPDPQLNHMMNGWLQHQTLTSRIRARTGLYQPGGAFGFRDQLQDMLAMLPSDPGRVRAHLLRSAERQFEDGDVMHWWHEPALGVRTRISDDLLFLPYVTAQYVKWTQDTGILEEQLHYLCNVEIEEGREDRFCEMTVSAQRESLHAHCMRAFRRADRTGEHGLIRIGSGDWNDGMNRVGAQGRGESVWLTEFMAVCAAEYAQIAPMEEDRAWLLARADQLSAAVEEHGWDGSWYLRAYADDGTVLGSEQSESCKIDAISQAWAALAGLDGARCDRALDAAWRMLVDEDAGIIRLITPPFAENGYDPGYIRGYPAGVRENGAQYTHGACWLLLAWIRRGDASRAHRALQLLLPPNHADTPERADRYRVEPYVVAADIYDGRWSGRGGWTWYTGSASWLYVCVLELLGFRRRGNRVRLHALLGDWPEATVTVRYGTASYRLVSRRGVAEIALDGRRIAGDEIEMQDDGQRHEAVFPAREAETHAEEEIQSQENRILER